ncbi:monovalent cation/H(+) antiporter subunit G [candidate division NPL-UPA2 bacterium]|nr:monovalent cation/H(+) antiporter subunit G [candidate division NPL-UPA2 bacterium]
MSEIVGMVIIAIGVVFDFFGCVGLVRFPDIYNRLQAATKCVTLGTCFILLGALITCGSAPTATKAALCAIFILLTSPTAAHALARGAHLSGVKLWEKSVVDKYEDDKKH